MKFLLLLIVVALAGAWYYPPYAEHAPNACAAFEKKMNTLVQAQAQTLPAGIAKDPRLAGVMGMVQSALQAANGALAESYIRDKFPQLPPALGCVAAYWKITFDPDLTQYVKGGLRLPQ